MPPILFRVAESKTGAGRRIGTGPLLGLAPPPAVALRVFGVTRDSAGAVLASATVHLFRTRDDVEVDEKVSDGVGAYEFRGLSPSEAYYVVAYKAGAPDVAGTTVNTLLGSA